MWVEAGRRSGADHSQNHASTRPDELECNEHNRINQVEVQGRRGDFVLRGESRLGDWGWVPPCRETSWLPTLRVVAVVTTTTTAATAPGSIVTGHPIPIATGRCEGGCVRWLILG